MVLAAWPLPMGTDLLLQELAVLFGQLIMIYQTSVCVCVCVALGGFHAWVCQSVSVSVCQRAPGMGGWHSLPTGPATSCHQSSFRRARTLKACWQTQQGENPHPHPLKHLPRVSSVIRSLLYCNQTRRGDSRRKSAFDPEVADRETQTHNNRKCSFFPPR